MSELAALIIENGSFIIMFLFCLFGIYVSSKHYKSVPGADLVLIGFLSYGIYALLAFTGPGFTGSYFMGFTQVSTLSSQTFVYFISFALRLGLILVIVGILRIAGGLKA